MSAESRPKSGRRSLWLIVFLAGLIGMVWLMFQLSLPLFGNQGYGSQAADCDDCGVVAWLEASPLIAAGVVAYCAVWGFAWLSRRSRKE